MLKKRIIPCLDIRDGRVVKGIQFENIRDAGDPVETARRYSQLGADEITFLDINATHEGRSTMFDVVERTAEQVFIPFTVGGGIRDIDTIREVLRRGADKISLNSPAVQTPELNLQYLDLLLLMVTGFQFFLQLPCVVLLFQLYLVGAYTEQDVSNFYSHQR